MTAARVVRVAAAVLQRADGKVLLAQRLAGTPFPGYWEFPGGKLEPGESAREALARELHEELGIQVVTAFPWISRRYSYPHADVLLHFFRVSRWEGHLHGRDGQALSWQTPGRFEVSPLLPANTPIMRALELPAVYSISRAEDVGEARMLAAAARAFETGTRLAQVREPSFPAPRRERFARAMLALARESGARLLYNGETGRARELGFPGVHWTSARLLAAASRPDDLICAASCHDASELQHAMRLDLDFVVLGPVCATRSHPGARPMGWKRFAELADGTSVPLFALGGLSPSDLESAQTLGAHGIAMRGAGWPDQDSCGPPAAESSFCGKR